MRSPFSGQSPHLIKSATLGVLIALLAACTTGSEAPTPSPTPEPTPQPTATQTPRPTLTPTLTPTTTPTPDIQATVAARATQDAALLMPEIERVLEEISLPVDRGRLGWANPEPHEITVREYGTGIFSEMDPINAYADFVLHIDVSWDSTSGLAGCGLVFRSERDIITGEQFRFYTMRLSGLPVWDVELWNYDTWQSTLTGSMKVSHAISLEPGSTNTYVLLAEGSLLTAYANGKRLGNVTILRRSEGYTGVFAWQESGETTCTFENAWIWVIE